MNCLKYAIDYDISKQVCYSVVEMEEILLIKAQPCSFTSIEILFANANPVVLERLRVASIRVLDRDRASFDKNINFLTIRWLPFRF